MSLQMGDPPAELFFFQLLVHATTWKPSEGPMSLGRGDPVALARGSILLALLLWSISSGFLIVILMPATLTEFGQD